MHRDSLHVVWYWCGEWVLEWITGSVFGFVLHVVPFSQWQPHRTAATSVLPSPVSGEPFTVSLLYKHTHIVMRLLWGRVWHSGGNTALGSTSASLPLSSTLWPLVNSVFSENLLQCAHFLLHNTQASRKNKYLKTNKHSISTIKKSMLSN